MSESVEPTPVLTAFFVAVNLDGTLAVRTADIPPVSVQREATPGDIEMYCSHIAREVGRSMLLQHLTPAPEPTTADIVSGALARRSVED